MTRWLWLVPALLVAASPASGQVPAPAAPAAPSADAGVELAGEIKRVVLGFEQVGAAGTSHDQKYSFNFFISRPLPFFSSFKTPLIGSPLRWWGDVRVGSYPQQVNSDIVTFAKNFATEAGKTPVNKLVQTAQFATGLEVRLPWQKHARVSDDRFALFAFVSVGAIGPFERADPPTVFAVPAAPGPGETPSPQYTAFRRGADTRDVTGAYVAFMPQTPDRFAHTFDAGLRLYTHFFDADGELLPQPPATVEIGVGTNRLVTKTGTVWRASAMYPFALGDRSKKETLVIYFYGDVVMKFGKPIFDSPAYVLEAALDADGAAIPLSHPQVTIVPQPPNDRDTYRIGVAVDLLRIFNKLTAPPPAS